MPRSWIQPSGNTLVLFEEMGGDPTQISFATRQAETLCAHVSELHPPPLDAWGSDLQIGQKSGPVLRLECPSPDQLISRVKFVSFGTPQGTCGTYRHGRCSSNRALSIVQQVCITRLCSVVLNTYVSNVFSFFFYKLKLMRPVCNQRDCLFCDTVFCTPTSLSLIYSSGCICYGTMDQTN